MLCWRGVTPLGEGCACSVQPLSPSSQKYCWVETRSPAVWPAQNSRLPDAWLLPCPHALGASSTTPGQDAEEAPEPRWPCQGILVSWAQSLGLHSTPCPQSTSWRATTRAAKVAQGPVQPSVDTLPRQASPSGSSLRYPELISFFP